MGTKKVTLCGVSAVALCLAGQAVAQTPSAPVKAPITTARPDGTDIIVTARRVNERLQDVPISITVFNQAQLTSRNIVNPADLATYTPSLAINQRYGPEKAAFSIRGFQQDQGTAPSVGVYFGDVVAPRALGGTTAGNGTGAGNLFDLQNIQVLKGPQGTLFGRNTTGGAILLVPQKPTSRLEGFAEGSIGDFDMRRVQAVANFPIMDSLRIRIGVDRNKRDGYLTNHSGVGPRDLNDLNYLALRFSAVADLTPNLENYAIISYSNSRTNGPYGAKLFAARSSNPGLPALATAQVARDTAAGYTSLLDIDSYNPDARFRLNTWQAIDTVTWQASDTLTVKNIVSYSQYVERSTFSLYGDNFGAGTGTPFSYIRLAPGESGDSASQSTFTEELRFQGKAFDDRLNWQAGGYLEVSEPLKASTAYTAILLNCSNLRALQCSSLPGIFANAGTVASTYIKTSFNNKGLFAQGTYKLTERLAVTAGVRYTWDRTTGTSESTRYRFAPSGVVTQVCNDSLRFQQPGVTPVTALIVSNHSQCHNVFTVRSGKPTWLVDLEYKPIEDILLYGKYSRGYRTGGVATSNIGFETWNPEKVDTFEAGAKTSFRSVVSGYFNVTGFYNNFTNQQIAAGLVANTALTGFAGGQAIINAGRSRIWGIEVDSSISPLANLRFDVGYTYLHTELLSLSPPSVAGTPFVALLPTAVVGSPLSFSPRNRVTATATYTIPFGEEFGNVSVAGTFTHTDAQNATSSTASAFFRLPSTNLVNLNVDWRGVLGRPIDLAFFMTNATNRIYPVGIGSAYSSGFETYLVAPPRMFGFRARYHFGG